MYPIVSVPEEARDILEPLGTKPKFWFQSKKYLFKSNRPQTEGCIAEDWSEKVGCELCTLLGLPHAHYDFATWQGERGVVTRNFVPSDGMLLLGNELLVRIEKGYPQDRFYRVKEHTLRLVLKIIKASFLKPPIDWQPGPGIESAFDVFVGYLMFDAWIANQDRHHENWGVVVLASPRPLTIHLAPTFDHASCLGWNERDEARIDRLMTSDHQRGMEAYVERARSAFFASANATKAMYTIDVFRETARQKPEAGKAWLDRLAKIPQNEIVAIFDQIPPDRITNAARQFALKMLTLNRNRLLNLDLK